MQPITCSQVFQQRRSIDTTPRHSFNTRNDLTCTRWSWRSRLSKQLSRSSHRLCQAPRTIPCSCSAIPRQHDLYRTQVESYTHGSRHHSNRKNEALHGVCSKSVLKREKLKIRDVDESDATAIANIYSHYVHTSYASFETEPPDAAEIQQRIKKVTQVAQLPYIVAEVNGRVIGYAYAGKYRERKAYQHTIEDSIYLHPDYVGKGHAKAMLSELCERCAKLNVKVVIAVIGMPNDYDAATHPSVRMHAKVGFNVCGQLPNVGFKHDRWLKTVLMQKQLS